MKKLLPYLLIFSALTVSDSSAFYSIFGLSKLFSGESMAVIIMAGSLEFAKVLITVVLHNYWAALSSWLKTYLLLSIIILVVITSAGIYGFLSNAYQQTSSKDLQITKQIELVEMKKKTFNEQKEELSKEKIGIITSIEQLRNSLGNNILQTVDKKTGQLIKTTSNETRKSYEKQLDDATKRRDKISDRIQILNDSISSFEIKILDIQNSSSVSSELGPLKYLSKLTGYSMDIVVNWFLILLIIVFDPLAIALILGASSILNSRPNKSISTTLSPSTTKDIVGETIGDYLVNDNLQNTPPTPPQTQIIQEGENPKKKEESKHLDEFIEDHKIDEQTEPIYEPFSEAQDEDYEFLMPEVKKKKN